MNHGPVLYHPTLSSTIQKLSPGSLGALLQADTVKKVSVTLSPTPTPAPSLKYWFPPEGASCLCFSSPSPRARLQKLEIPGPRVCTLPHAAPIHRGEEVPQGQQGRECQRLGGGGESEWPPVGVRFIFVGTKLFSAVLLTIT